MRFVISSNRLQDGSVVYLTDQKEWSVRLDDAWIVAEEGLVEAQELGKEAEDKNHIVESYAVEVDAATPTLPIRLRERIRSYGPTVGDQVSPLHTRSES